MSKRTQSKRSGSKGHSHRDLLARLTHSLIARPPSHGDVFALDLRGKQWDSLRPKWAKTYLTLRRPGDRGWPQKGRTTDDLGTALAWLEQGYVDWFSGEDNTRDGLRQASVARAAELFLKELALHRAPRHNTLIGWGSVFAVHVIPAFGDRPIASLTRDDVERFLMNLQVTKRGKGGAQWRARAKPSTTANVRSAMVALWKFVFVGAVPCPFADVRIVPKTSNQTARDRAEADEDVREMVRLAYTSEELRDLLIHAWFYDQQILGRPNLACSFLPATCAAIALIAGTGTRREESTFLRWRDVDWRRRAIQIPGTKTENADRWIPLQESLAPWLRHLECMQEGHAEPGSFVLQFRRRAQNARTSTSTLGARIDRVQIRAGLKRPQKAAHILRATHVSLIRLGGLDAESIKQYAGHARVFEGATDCYVDGGPEFLPEWHRRLMILPTPDEVAAAATEQLARHNG